MSIRYFIFALAVSAMIGTTALASGQWERISGCHLLNNAQNDGDSFLIRDGYNRTYRVRLYFVDTPETHDNDRIADQADYFDISRSEAVGIGKRARAFTKKVLENGFSITTRHQYFGEREYVIVTLPNGQDLGTMLVERGLARIHGAPVAGSDAIMNQLYQAERSAQQRQQGGWNPHNNYVAKARPYQPSRPFSTSKRNPPEQKPKKSPLGSKIFIGILIGLSLLCVFYLWPKMAKSTSQSQ